MARLSSKRHPFTIYDDAGIPTPDSTSRPSFCHATANPESDIDRYEDHEHDVFAEEDEDVQEEHANLADVIVNNNEEDDRRESALTQTSVSSLPESTGQSEGEYTLRLPAQKPYAPAVIRPSFRRPESVRRMQMTSPPPFGSRSPRHSVLRYSRSRAGTPQSLLSARGSPRPRRHISDQSEQEEPAKECPLVLLHVTLLPITLPWSMEAMHDLLLPSTIDNLQILRSQVGDVMLQRGLLILHPREEYELLEERLLEALELKEDRITKCGHFRRPRSSDAPSVDDVSDSGLGSSVEDLPEDDDERCATCSSPFKRSSKAGHGSSKWSIKVYAANGLMRAPAWAAAWSEMESVDVEILPWIDEETRKQLDARADEEAVLEQERREEEQRHMEVSMREQMQIEDERARKLEEVVRVSQEAPVPQRQNPPLPVRPEKISQRQEMGNAKSNELPQVYRPSEVPLTLLLRNYVFLLLQDRKNAAIFVLVLLAVLLGLRGTVSRSTSGLLSLHEEACARYDNESSLAITSAVNATGDPPTIMDWESVTASQDVIDPLQGTRSASAEGLSTQQDVKDGGTALVDAYEQLDTRENDLV